MARTPQTDATVRPTSDRILGAVIDWAAETGLRKLSMDEIAVRAGVARATLYLHFPGRQALIDAAVRHELERFFTETQAVADRYADPEERLVQTFAASYRWLTAHRVLEIVLRINPQLLLPYVLGDAPAIDLGRSFVAGLIDPAAVTGELTLDEFAEHVVRVFHTFVLAPPKVIKLDAPGAPEDYARRFLLPLLHGD